VTLTGEPQDVAARRSDRTDVREHGRRFTRADNPLVRAVGRVPSRCGPRCWWHSRRSSRCLIAVGVLGLGVLGRSNTRAEALGTLQLRVATYQTLQTQAPQLRQLLVDPQRAVPEREHVCRRKAGTSSAGAAGPRRPGIHGGALAARAGGEHGKPGVLHRKGRSAPRLDPAGRPPPRAHLDTDAGRRPGDCAEPEDLPLMRSAIATDKDLFDLAAQPRHDDLGGDERADRSERQLVHLVEEPVHRRRRGRCAPGRLVGLVLSWSVIGPVQRTEARLAESRGRLLEPPRSTGIVTSSDRWRRT